MKKFVLTCLIVLFSGVTVFVIPSFATVTIGYTDQNWAFKIFSGLSPAVGVFNATLANLNALDQPVTASGNILNGGTPSATVDVSGKKMAVLGHDPAFLLYPGNATSPFPSIWVKGNLVNSNAPAYIVGTDANKFYQTGLTVQAIYTGGTIYQWTVYMYADKDILSQTVGPATGKILDPRISTMRWFSWQDNVNGTPKMPWGVREVGATSPAMFNTMPLISGGTAAQIKAFLTGTAGTSIPENAGQFSTIISGMPQSSIPADGNTYYNTDRNTVSSNNANGFTISGRSQIGLVYASPSDNTCYTTQYIHIQFTAFWPKTIGVAPGSKSCTINVYQRTAN